MASKKILAFSSSRSGNSAFLELPSLVINEFIGSKPTNIAFIPFADADNKYEEYGAAVQNGLKNTALKINVVLPENATAVIEKADAIMVGGGNTFKLLHDLYELGILNKIREKVNGGTILTSDGAQVQIFYLQQFPRPMTCPLLNQNLLKPLGLFPFQINPHYFNKK